MDSKRFDNWTRNRALRLSRRNALRLMGVGGAAAALPILESSSLAQGTCSLTLHAETVAGPSAPTAYDGTLQFSLSSDGTFSQASFTPSSGGTQTAATGHATGRAIDVQIALPGNQFLSLSGVADRPISTCQATVAGIVSGPQPGDLGAWQATSGAAPVITSGQTSTNPPPAGSVCAAPSFACGPNCCPSGSTCTDTNQGICSCPAGTVQCGVNCVPDCAGVGTLDLDTCTCVAECLPDQSGCEFDDQCCGGECSFGICITCSGLMCGEMGCVDPMTDPFNCGACGKVCVDDTGFCLGGVCQCIPDGEPKGSSSSSCCSFGYVSTTGLCGCANIGEWCDNGGDCCQAGSLVHCLDGGSGFKECCRAAGSSCSSDAECCFSSPSYTPGQACVGGICGRRP